MNLKEKKTMRLNSLQGNCKTLIEGLDSLQNLGLITFHEQNTLKEELKHLYLNEIDYLIEAPKDYFEIYGDPV